MTSKECYDKNPAARAKKKKYDTAYMTSKKGLKKRAELKRIRRKAKKQGKNIAGKDYDHATKRFVSPSVNRGRKEKSRLKGSKRT